MTEKKSRGRNAGTKIEKKKKQMGNLCMPWIFGKFLKAVKKLLCLYQSSVLLLNTYKYSGNFYRIKDISSTSWKKLG